MVEANFLQLGLLGVNAALPMMTVFGTGARHPALTIFMAWSTFTLATTVGVLAVIGEKESAEKSDSEHAK